MSTDLVPTNPEPVPPGQMLIYSDGGLRLQVRLDGQTAWLTQAGLAELFQTTPQNITMHIAGIYEDGELAETATCKEFLQVRIEGGRQVHRSLKHYNLEMILAVGYRVRSHVGPRLQRRDEKLNEQLGGGICRKRALNDDCRDLSAFLLTGCDLHLAGSPLRGIPARCSIYTTLISVASDGSIQECAVYILHTPGLTHLRWDTLDSVTHSETTTCD